MVCAITSSFVHLLLRPQKLYYHILTMIIIDKYILCIKSINYCFYIKHGQTPIVSYYHDHQMFLSGAFYLMIDVLLWASTVLNKHLTFTAWFVRALQMVDLVVFGVVN